MAQNFDPDTPVASIVRPASGRRWGRGIFRLWLVLSLLWGVPMTGIAIVNALAARHASEAAASAPKSSALMHWDVGDKRMRAANRWERLAKGEPLLADDLLQDAARARQLAGIYFALGIVPPFLIGIIVGSLYWAVRGFRA